ncbi:TPA: glycosyltransferase family 2 protein [Morganella morganii]|nr:glycosyltransferase family 2 protein [Morganella morganii]
MKNPEVSVIIPSYNRAHILKKTLPSYFQEDVLEVIVINDASTDNTIKILDELKEQYEKLIIINNEKNIKQTGSKNKGLNHCKGKYIFFGDDDSILFPDAIQNALNTMEKKKCDIVGCRVLYMNNDDASPEACIIRHNNNNYFKCDLDTLTFNLSANSEEAIECFYPQAIFLCNKNIIKGNKFDINYTGNAYREETDFLLSLYKNSFVAYFEPKSLIINLPPRLATGGARNKNKLLYHWQTITNNWYFLKKNNKTINLLSGKNSTILFRQIYFFLSKLKSFTKKFIK